MLTMRYVAHVVVVFPIDQSGPGTFDIWENAVVLNSESPKKALDDAIAVSRSLLDDRNNCGTLGYSNRPVLYAVKSLYDYLALGRPENMENCHILTKNITIGKEELEKLRSFDQISVPFGLIHIDRP
jgi:hypothetical protein